MSNQAIDNAKEKYEQLFPTYESKAAAFDKIAEEYYFTNFGKGTKKDIDILMFSIYLEQILDVSEEDVQSYSDYTLSKLLGITQTKIKNLKVEKQLRSYFW